MSNPLGRADAPGGTSEGGLNRKRGSIGKVLGFEKKALIAHAWPGPALAWVAALEFSC